MEIGNGDEDGIKWGKGERRAGEIGKREREEIGKREKGGKKIWKIYFER